MDTQNKKDQLLSILEPLSEVWDPAKGFLLYLDYLEYDKELVSSLLSALIKVRDGLIDTNQQKIVLDAIDELKKLQEQERQDHEKEKKEAEEVVNEEQW